MALYFIVVTLISDIMFNITFLLFGEKISLTELFLRFSLHWRLFIFVFLLTQ